MLASATELLALSHAPPHEEEDSYAALEQAGLCAAPSQPHCRRYSMALAFAAAATAACVWQVRLRTVQQANVPARLRRTTYTTSAPFYAPSAPLVTLPTGARVSGTRLAAKGLPADDEVYAYFSIPYAVAERFESPRLVDIPNGTTVNGTQKNKRCFQKDWNGWSGVEDCLSLAVYTPTAPSAELRPVMVWIHGGNFVNGAIEDDAGKLNHVVAQGDVIVVAIQYRLGLFGFWQPPNDPGVPANRGLRDMIVALRWTQANIRSFGGDSASVTLWGQSAGGRAVVALHQSPLARGLFHRAIAESPGFQMTMFYAPTWKSAESLGRRCFEVTNCSSTNCMKAFPTWVLAEACNFYALASEFIQQPGVYFAGYDGDVLTHSTVAPLCGTVGADNTTTPMIVGSMLHEWRSFVGLSPQAMTRRFLWESMGGCAEKGQHVQDCEVATLNAAFDNARCDLEGDSCARFGRPSDMQSATDQYVLGVGFSLGPGAGRRYHYVFDIEAAGGTCGSCHCGELQLLFGEQSPEFVDFAFANGDEWQRLRKQIFDYWLSFVKTGVPSSSVGPEWAEVDRKSQSHGWGYPLMSFNLSSAVAMRSIGGREAMALQELTDTLCGRRELFSDCDTL